MMLLVFCRYATFLDLFALLDRAEKRGCSNEERRDILRDLANHEEDFFGR
jgi:hypothetical protein